MIAECSHCHEKINLDAEDAPWMPPLSDDQLGSIQCPNCGDRKDLKDYILHTGSTAG